MLQRMSRCPIKPVWANPHHYHKFYEVPSGELQPAMERAEKHLKLDASESEVTTRVQRELEEEEEPKALEREKKERGTQLSSSPPPSSTTVLSLGRRRPPDGRGRRRC